jgi:hypothetical protein
MRAMIPRLLVAGIAVFLTSCGSGEIPSGQPVGLTSVFAGFVYGGESSASDAIPVLALSVRLPKRLSGGKEYVFRHREPFDDLRFARVTVPRVLSQLGLTVSKTVDQGQGPIAFSSGMVWFVSFERSNCAGTISHDVDPALLKWPGNALGIEPAKYVLALTGDCAT